MLVVVSSDHGNLEDTRGGHTTHPVPVLALGAGRHAFAAARSITDVAPLMLAALSIDSTHDPRRDEP